MLAAARLRQMSPKARRNRRHRRNHGQRNDRLPPGGNRAPPHPEHERYVRAVDVGIEQTNAIAELGQAESEIDGNPGKQHKQLLREWALLQRCHVHSDVGAEWQ